MNNNNTNEENSTYIFRQTGEEQDLARLIELEKVMNADLGLLPPLPSELLSASGCGVDVGCGAGILTSGIAEQYPHLLVVGIDISTARLDYAQKQAELRGVKNVTFLQGDIRAQASWDALADYAQEREREVTFLHGRFLVSFLPWKEWPTYLQRCREILRPGGCLVLCESAAFYTNSEHVNRINELFHQVMQETGLLPPDPPTTDDNKGQGIAPHLKALVASAGFRVLKEETFENNATSGDARFAGNLQSLYLLTKELAPIVLKRGMSEEEWDALLAGAMRDWTSPSYTSTTRFERLVAQREPEHHASDA